MAEEALAAPAEDQTIDQSQVEDVQQPSGESAPPPEEAPAKPDPVQAKINKLVGQKHEANRKAEAAEARNKELEAQIQTQAPAKTDGAPKLEDFEYDDAKHQAALIKYEVQKAKEEFRQEQEQATQSVEQQKIVTAWNAGASKLGKEDIQERLGRLPQFPNETLLTLMQIDKGPKVADFLVDHLDIADEVAQMPPYLAAVKLGELSVQLSNSNPTDKPSAAPDPIDPLTSGGSAPTRRGPPGATFT